MKYILILIAVIASSTSCKSKKNMLQSNSSLADTFYVQKIDKNEIEMHIIDKNTNPNGLWTLQHIVNRHEDEMNRISLELRITDNEYTYSGNDGCNSYFGSLGIFDSNKISFADISKTERYCIVGAKHAKIFYKNLETVRSYKSNQEYLLLLNEKEKTVLQFIKKE